LPSRPSANAPEPDEQGGQHGLPFAVLPQAGYGPETGPQAGIKFEGRNLFGGRTFVGLNLLYSINLQQKARIQLGNPDFHRFMLFAMADYRRDPGMEFFGIGNNDVGPEPLSAQDIRRGRIGVLLGYRVLRRFALNVSAFYRETDIKNAHESDTLSTRHFAPGLPGIGGARANYLAASLVYNSRDEVVRPTRGWEVIFKYLNANHALFNDDADFQKIALDASFIEPLVWRRQVIAVHGNGEAMFGKKDDIPFFELSSLGGDDTMRGYFPYRFLGKGRLVFNVEYRLKLADFNFIKLWDVTIDGVGFGDAGRVYKDGDDFTHNVFNKMRYSYGGGARIGFSSGLVARIDAGFSPEETGLIYLSFGHTF
jgi:outer membrane protein assembly factor BamA